MADSTSEIFLELPALRVSQPLGDFYVITISAKDLLDISYAEPLRYIDTKGNVQGNQRTQDEKRLRSIATYIESVEMAFPNSIILAANYTKYGTISKDETERWRIIEDKKCNVYKIVIPKKIALAAIIDGQHRLKAFSFVKDEALVKSLQLVCSVYFDLPNSYQAFLFATINSNQKKVDRSLALEQFGYNVDDEPEKAWTPEKFAVFLSRKLNIESGSPFYKHIKVAPLNIDKLFPEGTSSGWVVSTATIVDGIGGLISSNVKRDRILMQHAGRFSGRSRSMIKEVKDVSPLRDSFINSQDKTVYDTIVSYFNSFKALFWNKAGDRSYIIKTVGVQASFDILKMILNQSEVPPDQIDFTAILKPAAHIDFSDKFFQASGIGRSRIKNSIGLAADLIDMKRIKKNDITSYTSVIEGKSTAADKQPTAWETAAEEAVANFMDKVQWNYDSNSVSIVSDESDHVDTLYTYKSFFAKLSQVAFDAFTAALPDDPDFAGDQAENLDTEDLVNSVLVSYEPNLKQLGWIAGQ